MRRRDFLRCGTAGLTSALAGASGLLSWTPRAHATTITRTYYITEGFIPQPDGIDVYFRGFSDDSSSLNVPGQPLTVQEGDTVEVTVHNTLGSEHSFVIDGVVDSGVIRGGESSTIDFVANTPGSYLYYDGLNAPYSRLAGLHGAMAVMPNGSSSELYAGSPTFSQQYFWVFNDIDPAWNEAIRNGSTPSTDFVPRYFTINGLSARPPGATGNGDPSVDAMHDPNTALHGHVGDRTLIRLLNPSLCSHSVHWHGNHVEWLTKDGEIRPDVPRAFDIAELDIKIPEQLLHV